MNFGLKDYCLQAIWIEYVHDAFLLDRRSELQCIADELHISYEYLFHMFLQENVFGFGFPQPFSLILYAHSSSIKKTICKIPASMFYSKDGIVMIIGNGSRT